MKKRLYPLLLLVLTCLLCAAQLACASEPVAVLHTASDPGYLPYAQTPLKLTPDCPQAFVFDLSSEEIVYMKGSDRVIRPASVTKLLTALYALTVLKPDQLITPGEEVQLIAPNSSIAYIKTHHTLRVDMLIEGMLLPSGNDAAYALAGAAGREISGDSGLSGEEAVRVFMEGMNEYARQIGCVGSNFTVPDGYDADGAYTTAEDLILIGRLAAENEIIRRYAALAADHVTYADGSVNDWTNTNRMLNPADTYYHPAVRGLKTGSLDNSYSLLCLAADGDRQYLIGLFSGRNKNTRFADALKICHTLFD